MPNLYKSFARFPSKCKFEMLIFGLQPRNLGDLDIPKEAANSRVKLQFGVGSHSMAAVRGQKECEN